MGMFDLPTREGYMVRWYTGKVSDRTRRYKDGTVKVIGQIRHEGSWISPSKEKADQKAEELRKQGFEVIGIFECFY